MPCRAITLYLFLGLAREAQGHGEARTQSPWLYRDSILMYICCKKKPLLVLNL